MKKHISSYLFFLCACVCVSFFLTWKVCCPRKTRRGLLRSLLPGLFWAVQHLCSAAYLCTFCLQLLFKESEMLLISFYCFHLSLLSPFSSSADDTHPPTSHLLMFHLFPPLLSESLDKALYFLTLLPDSQHFSAFWTAESAGLATRNKSHVLIEVFHLF